VTLDQAGCALHQPEIFDLDLSFSGSFASPALGTVKLLPVRPRERFHASARTFRQMAFRELTFPRSAVSCWEHTVSERSHIGACICCCYNKVPVCGVIAS
jgi:hypothetical protein